MAPGNETVSGELAVDSTRYFTRDEVDGALARAVAEVEFIAGEDGAIDLLAMLAAGKPPGKGPFTVQDAVVAWSASAELAKDGYNPGHTENSRTIRSDSWGGLVVNLVVNLAVGFLGNPGSDADDVIAARWPDLEPLSFEGFEVWNSHVNDLGDHCPWSGRWATPDNREALVSGLEPDDDLCPQGCRSSALNDPIRGSAPYQAAIVATVKGWLRLPIPVPAVHGANLMP